MRSARRAAELDAVTVDAFGTLVLLDDPASPLQAALAEHGIERPREAVAAAFLAEAAHYRPRSSRGRDATSLEELRLECVGVFLDRLEAPLQAAGFVPAFMRAISFRLAPGSLDALDRLRAAGLGLACVANWDVSLREQLEGLGVADRFHVILSSAEAGAEKPEPAIFQLALDQLAVPASRSLHVGDEHADREGASAAGMAYESEPLSSVPERIDLR